MPAQPQKQHRWPFDVRPLTPKLGAEIIGVDLARGVDDALFRSIHRGLPAVPGAAVRPAGPAAGTAGGVRPPFRRGADPRDEPVSRRRPPRAVSPVQPRRERQSEREAPGQGHAGVAHRRLVAPRHRPGHHHLRRSRRRRGRRDALLRHVRRLRAPEPGMEGADREPARGAQPRFLAHAPPRRGPDDRGAAPRSPAGGPPDRAHAPGDRAQVPVPGGPRRVHRRHGLRRRPRA